MSAIKRTNKQRPHGSFETKGLLVKHDVPNDTVGFAELLEAHEGWEEFYLSHDWIIAERWGSVKCGSG